MGLDGSDLGSSTGLLDQATYRFAQLSATLLPMRYATQLKTQTFLTFSCQWAVETNALDETAIATIARISHNHVVVRTILGTAARKTNDYHNEIHPKIDLANAKGREFYDTLTKSGNQLLDMP
jgi:hypothetical protein